MDKGRTVRKNITYHTERDKEIHEWLKGLPMRGHSEAIRQVLKKHIREENKGKTESVKSKYVEELEKRLEKIEGIVGKHKINIEKGDLNTEKDAYVDNKEELREEDFIDATDILKDLGK